MFDTVLQPEEVMAYYPDRLPADGWAGRSKDVETAHAPAGGFRFADPPGRVGRLFCRGEQGPTLRVFAAAPRHTATQVHLEVDRGATLSRMATEVRPCHAWPLSSRKMP